MKNVNLITKYKYIEEYTKKLITFSYTIVSPGYLYCFPLNDKEIKIGRSTNICNRLVNHPLLKNSDNIDITNTPIAIFGPFINVKQAEEEVINLLCSEFATKENTKEIFITNIDSIIKAVDKITVPILEISKYQEMSPLFNNLFLKYAINNKIFESLIEIPISYVREYISQKEHILVEKYGLLPNVDIIDTLKLVYYNNENKICISDNSIIIYAKLDFNFS